MPQYDFWSADVSERALALQERSDAVAQDKTKSIPALGPLEPIPPLQGVLLRRASDLLVVLVDDDEAERLMASGEYRPVVADDRWSESGTLSCQADPHEVEYARKEKIQALAKLMSLHEQQRGVQDTIEAVETRVASMSDEEVEALQAELIQPVPGSGAGLVRVAERS